MNYYNTTLKYKDAGGVWRTTKLNCSSSVYGWQFRNNMAQTRSANVWHKNLGLTQNDLVLSGQHFSQKEKDDFALFISSWQRYASSSSKPNVLRLVVSPRKTDSVFGSSKSIVHMDYLVIPLSVPRGGRFGEFAPTWSMTFKIARDMLNPSNSFQVSQLQGNWIWDSSYKGAVLNVDASLIYNSGGEPDTAFLANPNTVDTPFGNGGSGR